LYVTKNNSKDDTLKPVPCVSVCQKCRTHETSLFKPDWCPCM